MAERPDLSVIIIAKDEARDLPSCLASVQGLAREIVLVDDGSKDATPRLAAEAGARVLARRLDSFARQKQFALDNAKGEWVLELDADEEISPELAAEIRRTLSEPGNQAGYHLHRLNRFMGRVLRFGGQGSQYKLRLFRRSAARFDEKLVHEGAAVDGPLGRLRGGLMHTPYADLGEYFEKFNRYTALAAQERFDQGRRFRPWHHLLLPGVFVKCYLLRLGFLDGAAGFVWAALSALYHWTKHLRLRELEMQREEAR